MTDIVERLRTPFFVSERDVQEAIDAINYLRAENARLREERDLLNAILTNVALSMEAFDNYADIREGGNDECS